MGALDVSKVVHGHQAWRLITCIWLHAGVVHLLANMLSLLFIGIRLEKEFGFGMQQIISFSVANTVCRYVLVWYKECNSFARNFANPARLVT